MLERGWEVTACDVSPSMLELARKKTDDARLGVADLRRLPHLGKFDLVWALGDVLNMDELLVGLQGMHRNLKPNGLLMFDLNTLRTYRTIFSQREITERDGTRMTWNGLASNDTPPNSVCTAEVRVEKADNDQEHEMHMHVQRHFPEDQILQALTVAGLECLDVLGQHQDSRGLQPLVDETVHIKAVYIARKST
jgi:SAM-dependent methyltransferase